MNDDAQNTETAESPDKPTDDVAAPADSGGTTKGGKVKLIVVAVVLAGLFVTFKFVPVGGYLEAFSTWVGNMGYTGKVVFGAGYVICTVLFIPGSILTLAAGALFGPVIGTIVVSLASTTGAVIAFLIARYFMRSQVESWVQDNKKFGAIDRAVGKQGAKIVLLTRLSPVFPFNLLNYAFGLTRVRLTSYFVASLIGMLPGTALYVFLGAAVGNVSQIVSQAEPLELVVFTPAGDRRVVFLAGSEESSEYESAPDTNKLASQQESGTTIYAPTEALASAYLEAAKPIEDPGEMLPAKEFVTRFTDGGLWVFAADSEALRSAKYFLKTGVGVKGITVRSPDGDVLAAYAKTQKSLTTTIFFVVGLLLTVVVTVYVTRVARRALQEAAGDLDGDGGVTAEKTAKA